MLTLCLLPTASVLAWAVAQHLPSTHSTCEQDLGQYLGLRVVAERITRPRPGIIRWNGLTLVDPETGERLLWSPFVEAISRDDAWVLQMTTARIESSRADRIWSSIATRLRRPDAPTVRLTVRDLVLVSDRPDDGPFEQTLHDVRVELKSVAESTQLRSSFRYQHASSSAVKDGSTGTSSRTSSVTQLSVVRNRQTAPPSTQFELRTGETPLPCSLLAVLGRAGEQVASSGKFRGYIWATRSGAEWTGELAGEFTEFDLDNLVATDARWNIGGPARLTIERARFGNGRISELSGALRSGPGTIDRDLLDRSTTAFRMVAISPNHPSAAVAFDELAATFDLRPAGLTIHGVCAQAPLGTLLVSDGHPALFTQRQEPLPLVALLNVLVPRSTSQGPMSADVQRLARVLPMAVTENQRVTTRERKTIR